MAAAMKNVENYANSQITKSDSITEVLKQDKKECEEKDIQTLWYHGKMTRQNAEKILFDAIKIMIEQGTDYDGTFLVRDSTASPLDFSLSLLFDRRCVHFFIKQIKEGFFCIDGGPVIQGLEKLIDHYIESQGGLPTRLKRLCKGKAPPAQVRKLGPTNLLHTAVIEKNEGLVKKILIHPLCPDIQAKNENGNTALHEAAARGFDKAVSLLLSHGADLKIKDAEGRTPLHQACSANCASVCHILINHDIACVQERSCVNNQVPLHLAAMFGNLECLKVLLNSGAALSPRSSDNETPLMLAERYRRIDCVNFLNNFKGLEIAMKQERWLHEGLDRQTTEQLFRGQALYDGLFLVTSTDEGHHRLSLFYNETIRHFKIMVTDYRGSQAYLIDNGPYHSSLEALVDYHTRFEDGCRVLLKYPIAPVVPVQICSKEPAKKLPSPRSSAPNSPLPAVPVSPEVPAKPVLAPKPALKNSQKKVEKEIPAHTAKQHSLPSSVDSDRLKVIDKRLLKLGKEIGTGEYGSVLRAELVVEKKKLFGKEKVVEVAIKTFHNVGSQEDFEQEARVMQSLKNEYIVELLGVCNGPPLMLIEEYVPMGSMLSFLEDHPDQVHVKQELYLWAAQIAEGMMYLETQRLVHRDLAARNILLRTKHHAKISDFGLSRAMGTDKEYYKASKGGRWPIKWYAPECVNFGHFSHASDVWSYGVTLWEMFSLGEPPYENMSGYEVIKYVEDGQRLLRPEKCPPGVYEVMRNCWKAKPSDRPTFLHLNRHFDEEPEYASTKELKRLTKIGI